MLYRLHNLSLIPSCHTGIVHVLLAADSKQCHTSWVVTFCDNFKHNIVLSKKITHISTKHSQSRLICSQNKSTQQLCCCCCLVAKSCPTLYDPMDSSAPGSSIHGILQTRILEWVYHFLFQGIFLTQGLNPHLLCVLHWQVGSSPLASPGKPKALYSSSIFFFFFLSYFRDHSHLLLIFSIW